MKEKKKALSGGAVIVLLAVILAAVALISLVIGRYSVPVFSVCGILLSRFLGLIDSFLQWLRLTAQPVLAIPAFWDETQETVIMNIRLPRILLACLVGCSLSSAGASYQGVFQNPMAAPDILGASSGAAFGAALAILLGLSSGMITLFAFCFSLITVAVVYIISKQARGKQVLSIILAGIMVSSLFSSGTSYIKLVADTNDQLPAITYWLMGSLSAANMKLVGLALIPMAVGLVPLLLLRWRINVLTLGDDEARTLGVNTSRLRFIVIVCSTLITAASVAVSGIIGWVGLVIPHLARRLVGNNYRHLMPVTMLFGAVFMLSVDDVSRNLLTVEIPIGILTSFIGAPFFIYLITRKGES